MTGAPAGNENTTQHPNTTTASERVRDADFPLTVRGYDRRAVDEYVAELTELVDELEGRQLRERVVQRALDEVGEETAGILQHAHESADELSARSRAQAEGRLQRAEREAELAKAEADRYAEQVAVEIRRLWEERNQLIDEVRRLADEVLATADEAAERLKVPEAVAAALPDTSGAAPSGERETARLAPAPTIERPQPAPVAGEES